MKFDQQAFRDSFPNPLTTSECESLIESLDMAFEEGGHAERGDSAFCGRMDDQDTVLAIQGTNLGIYSNQNYKPICACE